ncbi:MAG: peptidoglycan-binding protein, partial [Actinomycetia bacterium]|nr:peptidoglycan-binding protein [Actinomycetes bacterium]
MKRRGVLMTIGALVVVGAVVSGAVMVTGRDSHGRAAASDAASTSRRVTATVTRRDLAETTDAGGTLGYGTGRNLAIAAHGTITALPVVGTVIGRGGKIAEVDGRPVVLLYGFRPAWRTLAAGVTDGPDVQQLEANLIALGYGTAANLGPNNTWSYATTAAVKRWQLALGVDDTGAVAPSDIVVTSGPVRVAEAVAAIGDQAGGPIYKVTDTRRVVDVSLDAAQQSLVKVGEKVQVELPDGTLTPGTVATVGSVAVAGDNGASPTIPVTVTLTDEKAGVGLDAAPVTVKLTTKQASAVLAVPVGALLALAEGG